MVDVIDRIALAAKPNDPNVRLRFGRKLLERNPDSILGRMLVAQHAATEVEREALLRDAVRIGMRLWAAEIEGRAPVEWFADKDTRLFMAAVSAYGRVLRHRGLEVEARQCVDFLLGLDPSDRLSVHLEVMGGSQASRQRPRR